MLKKTWNFHQLFLFICIRISENAREGEGLIIRYESKSVYSLYTVLFSECKIGKTVAKFTKQLSFDELQSATFCTVLSLFSPPLFFLEKRKRERAIILSYINWHLMIHPFIHDTKSWFQNQICCLLNFLFVSLFVLIRFHPFY